MKISNKTIKKMFLAAGLLVAGYTTQAQIGSSVTISFTEVGTLTAPADDTACANATVAALSFNLTGSADSFVIDGGTSGLANTTVTTAQIPSFTAASTAGSHTITITPFLNGCVGTPVTYDFEILPVPTVNTVADIVVCVGNPINATFSGTNATGFNWTNTNSATGVPVSGSGNISVTAATVTAQETGTVTVIPIHTTGTVSCPGTSTDFDVTVNPLPAGSIAAVDDEICTGAQAQLIFTATAGTAPFEIEYSVNSAGSPYTTETAATSPHTFNVNAPLSTINSYQLFRIEDANGCVLQ